MTYRNTFHGSDEAETWHTDATQMLHRSVKVSGAQDEDEGNGGQLPEVSRETKMPQNGLFGLKMELKKVVISYIPNYVARLR